MKRKMSEKENKITDKEVIMVNDIDVSGCEHYDDESCTSYRDSCGYPLDCTDYPNCLYKQLDIATKALNLIANTGHCTCVKDAEQALKQINESDNKNKLNKTS